MTHHHHQKAENYDKLYYTAGLLSGIFCGLVINGSIILMVILGIFGLFFTAFFLQLLVKGREDA